MSLTPVIQFFHRIMSSAQANKEYKGPNVQQAGHNSSLYLMAMVVIFFCGSTLYNFVPRALLPEEVFFRMPRKFKAADGGKRLALIDLKTCEIMAERERLKMDYRFYLDDFRDFIELSIGTLSQDQLWYYRTKEGVVDYEGNALYFTDGPESRICNHVEMLGESAKSSFSRDGEYEEDICNDPLAKYRNPFTKKSEFPSFERVTIGEGKSAEQANSDRVRLYTNLLTGGPWPGGSQPHKGQIRCLTADFVSPRGVSKAFFVQVIGKDGNPLSGSTPGVNFLYAQEDGKEYLEGLEKPVFPKKDWFRPQCIWLFQRKPDAILAILAKAAPYVVLFLLFAIFVVPRLPLARLLRRSFTVALLPISLQLLTETTGCL